MMVDIDPKKVGTRLDEASGVILAYYKEDVGDIKAETNVVARKSHKLAKLTCVAYLRYKQDPIKCCGREFNSYEPKRCRCCGEDYSNDPRAISSDILIEDAFR